MWHNPCHKGVFSVDLVIRGAHCRIGWCSVPGFCRSAVRIAESCVPSKVPSVTLLKKGLRALLENRGAIPGSLRIAGSVCVWSPASVDQVPSETLLEKESRVSAVTEEDLLEHRGTMPRLQKDACFVLGGA